MSESSYDLTAHAEYVSPHRPPTGDLFDDPEEVARVLELTHLSLPNNRRVSDEP
jgi:hypothetical protein